MHCLCTEFIPSYLFQSNSFMTEDTIMLKLVNGLVRKTADWFLYDTDLRHERVNKLR